MADTVNVIREVMKDSARPFIRDLFVELLGTFAAQLGIHGLFSNRRSREEIDRAKTLAADGKIDEAFELLKTKKGGVGMADEMILMTDILAMMRGRLVDPDQRINDNRVNALAGFICSLTVSERRKFRQMQTLEQDPGIRRGNLVQLAKLNTNHRRRHFLEASGIFAPDAIDRLAEFDRTVHKVNRQMDRRSRVLTENIRTRHAGRGVIGMFNPFEGIRDSFQRLINRIRGI